MVKILINGYGTIGKRVADAVNLQKDFELVGIAKTKPDFEARLAIEKGYPIFCSADKNIELFKKEGLGVRKLEDGLKEADAVIDCTPEGIGAQNKILYQKLKKKAIFEGGEEADIGVSFVAQCNYEKAINASYIRVVSCNTTGLCRTLGALQRFGIEKVAATLIRRSADPNDIKTGPINALVPDVEIPSHHAEDVQTVLPLSDIMTIAIKAPTTLMHVHSLTVELKEKQDEDAIIDTFKNTTRIRLVKAKDGLKSTAHIMELAKGMGRKRGDMYEICIWEDSTKIKGNTLYYLQAVHQESNVVPENIDAVRAMFNLASKEESIKKTNQSLGII